MIHQYAEFAEMERAGWADRDVAGRYADLFTPISEQTIPAIAATLAEADEAPVDVLDLCCGPGCVAEALVADGYTVTGLDFSPAMIAIARSRTPAARFRLGDAQKLDLPDDSFDAVVSNFGICHVPDQPAALAEIARVLRPGGQLILTAWCGPDQSPSFRIVADALAEHGDAGAALPPEPAYHRFADFEEAHELLGAAGLYDITMRRVDCSWMLRAPGALFEVISRGTLRAASLLGRQPEDNRKAIARAMERTVARECAADGIWQVPQPAALVTARL